MYSRSSTWAKKYSSREAELEMQVHAEKTVELVTAPSDMLVVLVAHILSNITLNASALGGIAFA